MNNLHEHGYIAMRKTGWQFSVILILLISSSSHADIAGRDDVQQFIHTMVETHGFERRQLESVFQQVSISNNIIKAISKPAEALLWYQYRPIFLKPERVSLGVKFWHEHKATLAAAQKVYGVPIEIIVAIIGIETRYGQHKGKYKVLESLATLAFAYPRRASFFRGELEQFLLLAREQNMDPLVLKGSYAGAMGMPQFISSSYRHYAVDFDQDGQTDIWDNPVDAIGSVGNYLKVHGWRAGDEIIVPAEIIDDRYLLTLSKNLKPDMAVADLGEYGIRLDKKLDADEKVKFLGYVTGQNIEYWLALYNFYVITRYNHSALYAMAVYQLAEKIRAAYLKEQA